MNCSSATWVGKSWISLTCLPRFHRMASHWILIQEIPQEKPMAKLDPSFKGSWKKNGRLGMNLVIWLILDTCKNLHRPAWHINEGTMAKPASQQSSQPVIFFCRWMNTGTCKLKTNMKIDFIIATKPSKFQPISVLQRFLPGFRTSVAKLMDASQRSSSASNPRGEFFRNVDWMCNYLYTCNIYVYIYMIYIIYIYIYIHIIHLFGDLSHI